MNTVLTLALLLGANAYEGTWREANAAYGARDFTAAARGYEQLAASGVADAAVFHNLGNAYYRLGALGAAIANYERALQLNPGLEPARENLDQSIRQTRRRLARPVRPDWQQSLLFWDAGLRPSTALRLAGLSWLACWSVLALRLWRPVRFLRPGAALLLLLAALFSLSAWSKYHPPQLAVTLREELPVRFGMSEAESVRFELYEGDRVLVDERMQGWARVTTVSGERGWTREEGLLLVGPPYMPGPALAEPQS